MMNFEIHKKDMSPWLLLHGIKGLLRCDLADVVHGIAHFVLSQYKILGLLSRLMEKYRHTSIPARVAFGGGAIRGLEPRTGKANTGVAWVAHLANERRAIKDLIPIMAELNWNEFEFSRIPQISGISTIFKKYLSDRDRLLRLSRLLFRRGLQVFEVMRVIDLIGYYVRYVEFFETGKYRLAVMSSHSNPHGIAFNLAARKCGVPVVLISHGMPIRPVANLKFDLAIVHCNAAKEIYAEAGCKITQIFIHGRRQDYREMPDSLPERMSLAIFLCKDVNKNVLIPLVEYLLNSPRTTEITIRPHPKNLWLGLEKWIEEKSDPRLRKSQNDDSPEDIKEVDIVFGGNSSVLIEAVTAGRPAVYVEALDFGPPDLHSFVADGLISAFRKNQFDPESVLAFYHQPEWKKVLRHYANLDEDQASVMSKAINSIQNLATTSQLTE